MADGSDHRTGHWEALHIEAFRAITSEILDFAVNDEREKALHKELTNEGEKLLYPLFREERATLATAVRACRSKWADSLVSPTPSLLTDDGDMNPSAHFMLLLNECKTACGILEEKAVPIGVVAEVKISESGRLLSAVDAIATQDALQRNVELDQLKAVLQTLLSVERAKTSYLAKFGPPSQSALYQHYKQEQEYKASLEFKPTPLRPNSATINASNGLLTGKELTAKCALMCRDSFCQGGFPFLAEAVLQESIDRVTERVDVVEALHARVPDLQRYRAININDRLSTSFKHVEQLHTLASFRARRKSAIGGVDDGEDFGGNVTVSMHALPSSEAVKLLIDARNEIQGSEADLLQLIDKYPYIVDELPHLIPSYTKERMTAALDKCQSSEGYFWDYRNKESRVNVRIEREEAEREIVALDLLIKGGVPDAEEDQLVPYPQRIEREDDSYGRSVLSPAPPPKHTNLSSLKEKLLALETEELDRSEKKLLKSSPSPTRRLQQHTENNHVVTATSNDANPAVSKGLNYSDGVEVPDVVVSGMTNAASPKSEDTADKGAVDEEREEPLEEGAAVTLTEMDQIEEDAAEAMTAVEAEIAVTSSDRRDEVEHQQLCLQLEYRQHEGRLFENEDVVDVRDPSINQDPDYYDPKTRKPVAHITNRDREFLKKYGKTIFARVKGQMLFADLPEEYSNTQSSNLADVQRREIISMNTKQRFEGTISSQLSKIRALEGLGVTCALVPSTTYELGHRDPLRHSTLLPIAGSIDRSERLDERTNYWLSTRAPQFMMSAGGGIHSAKYLDGPSHFMYNTRSRDVFLGNYQVSVKPLTVRQLLSIADMIKDQDTTIKMAHSIQERNRLSAAVNSIPHTQCDTFVASYFEPTMMSGRLETFVEQIRKRRCDVRSPNSDIDSERNARELGLLYDDDTVEVPYFVAEAISAAVGGVVCPVDVWEAAARGVDRDPHTDLPREFLMPQIDVEGELGVERLYWHLEVKGHRINRDVPGYSWRISPGGAAHMRSFKGPFGHALLGRRGHEWNSSIPLTAATDADMKRIVEKNDKRHNGPSGLTARELLKQQIQAADGFVHDAALRFTSRPDVIDVGTKEARFGQQAVLALGQNGEGGNFDTCAPLQDLDALRPWLPRSLNHRYLRQAAYAAKRGSVSTSDTHSKSPMSITELLSGDDDTSLNKLREDEGCGFPTTGASSHILRSCFDHNTQVLFEGEVISRPEEDKEDSRWNDTAAAITSSNNLYNGYDIEGRAGTSNGVGNDGDGSTTPARPATSGGATQRSAFPLLRVLDLQPAVSRPGTSGGTHMAAIGRLGANEVPETPSPLKRRRQVEARRRALNAKDYDNEHSFSGPAFHTFSLPNKGVPVAAFRIAIPVCDKALAQVRRGTEVQREQSGLNLGWEGLMEALYAGLPREGNPARPSPFDVLFPDVVQTDPSYGTATWVLGAAGMDLTFGPTFPHRLESVTLFGSWKGIRTPLIEHATTMLKITTKTFRDATPREAARDPGFRGIQLPLVGSDLQHFISALTGRDVVNPPPITATPVEVGNLRIVFIDHIVVPPASSHLPSTVFKAKITMYVVTDQQTGDKLVSRATIEKVRE